MNSMLISIIACVVLDIALLLCLVIAMCNQE